MSRISKPGQVRLNTECGDLAVYVTIDPEHYGQAVALKIKHDRLILLAGFESLVLLPDDIDKYLKSNGAVMQCEIVRRPASTGDFAALRYRSPHEMLEQCMHDIAKKFNARFDVTTMRNVENMLRGTLGVFNQTQSFANLDSVYDPRVRP